MRLLTTQEATECLITIPQAAKRWDFSERSLSQRAYRIRNGIPFLAIGRAIRFREADILEWLDSRKGLKAREVKPKPVTNTEG